MDDFPESDFTISVGGPVSNNTVHYIHTLGAAYSRQRASVPMVFSGEVILSLIKELIAEGSVKPHELRFFLGYAGWSARSAGRRDGGTCLAGG